MKNTHVIVPDTTGLLQAVAYLGREKNQDLDGRRGMHEYSSSYERKADLTLILTLVGLQSRFFGGSHSIPKYFIPSPGLRS